MAHLIRTVRPSEWPKAKELSLASLADPVAPVAYVTTLADVEGNPDSFWQQRAERAARGTSVRQFVAEGPDGGWDGTVTVLVERPGEADFFGTPIEAPQAHLVGVFVRAGSRGGGLADRLCEAAAEWAWSLRDPEMERVRLFVHRDNPRALAFYRRFGFVATGLAAGQDLEMEIRRKG
jgi:GNAT superfamily N-acetyltransferase